MTISMASAAGIEQLASRGDLAPPSATSLTGPTPTWAKLLYNAPNGKLTTGYWRCDPGQSRWEFTERGEVIHVFSGRMTVLEDGGEPVEIGPGDDAAFPMGWVGTWTIHETITKFFVIYR